MANKLKTAGYVIKRLRDSGFIVNRSNVKYLDGDFRRWTVIVDHGDANVFLTCYENYPHIGDVSFEINDGGNRWRRNFILNTNSVEVIIFEFIEKGISTFNKDNPLFKERIKNV